MQSFPDEERENFLLMLNVIHCCFQPCSINAKKSYDQCLNPFESSTAYTTFEEFVNELDEVVVRPYNLSGDLNRDMQQMKTDPVVTASTLGLPNVM